MRRSAAGVVLAVAVTAGLLASRAGGPGGGDGERRPPTQDLLVPVPVGSPEVRDDCGYRGLTGCGGSAVRVDPTASPR